MTPLVEPLLVQTKKIESKNIKRQSGADYQLFPNPTATQVYIGGGTKGETVNIEITDVYGRKLSEQKIVLGSIGTMLNVDLNNGIYFVSVTKENKVSVVKKLIISR